MQEIPDEASPAKDSSVFKLDLSFEVQHTPAEENKAPEATEALSSDWLWLPAQVPEDGVAAEDRERQVREVKLYEMFL